MSYEIFLKHLIYFELIFVVRFVLEYVGLIYSKLFLHNYNDLMIQVMS
jgi:hypothetical protein